MKKLFILFLLVFTSVKAQYTKIPDINFENMLIDQGIDTGLPDGQVLTSNINTIDSLYLQSGKILDLTGIQGFVNLIDLDCGYNLLSNLDLSKNIKLISLNCRYNKLTNLDLSNNLELNDISCHFNNLASINFSGNSKLRYIKCNNNLLTNLDFTGNPVLGNLFCYDNNIKDINFSGCPKIVQAECSNNLLTKLDFSANTELIRVSCDNNLLSSLDFSNNPKLNFISCYNNLLGSLDVSKNLNLEYLYCFNNQIKNLNLSFPNFLLFKTGSWINNPDLKCIYVLDINFFNSNFLSSKDAIANYFNSTSPKFESSTQIICSKGNPTLQNIVVSGNNIKWFDSQVNGNELSNSTPLIEGTTYFAMSTFGDCESERSSVKISLLEPTAPIALPTQILCNIQNPTLKNLTVTGNSIQWYNDINGSTPLSINTSLINNKTYFVSQSSNGCESPRSSVLVNILGSKPVLPNSPQTFCLQQNATLNSITITGQNIKWYDAATNGNLIANTTLLQNGTTYFASQTINSCESERIAVLINIQNTATPIANSPQTFCASQNPSLKTLTITGTDIKWYDNATAGNLLSDTTVLQNGQTYYASQTLNNCESPTRLAVNVDLISTLPANDYAEFFCDDLNDGAETVDLSSFNDDIISNPTDYTFSFYNSRLGAEKETSNEKINSFSTYKLVVGENKIYVRINSNTPCFAISELKMTLFAEPIINIQDIVPICEKNTVTIDAGLGFDSYDWSNGDKTQTTTIANAGDYDVTVTQKHGNLFCTATKNFKVVLSNIAEITNIETQDWSDNENTIIVKLAPTSIGDYEYSIDGINYQTSNQFSGLKSGKYTVSVRDKNNCGIVESNEIYLLMFPKYFTPNGDGKHDTWKINFSEIEFGLTVKIFDRFGKLIKTLSNDSDGWNGTFNGAEMPTTDYWFVVTRADNIEYKGHFSLKR